jgi:hypothetical protein
MSGIAGRLTGDLSADPALEQVAQLIHQADLGDDIFDARSRQPRRPHPRPHPDQRHDLETLAITYRRFDGLYAHIRRDLVTPRSPTRAAVATPASASKVRSSDYDDCRRV